MENQLTVGELLEAIEKSGLPMDAPVYFERIEDVCFEKNNWKSKKMPGMHYYMMLDSIQKAKAEWNDKTRFPKMTQKSIDMTLATTEEELESFKDEYVRARWSGVYNNCEDGFFIKAHF